MHTRCYYFYFPVLLFVKYPLKINKINNIVVTSGIIKEKHVNRFQIKKE